MPMNYISIYKKKKWNTKNIIFLGNLKLDYDSMKIKLDGCFFIFFNSIRWTNFEVISFNIQGNHFIKSLIYV